MSEKLEAGNIVVDLISREAIVGGTVVPLSNRAFRLLVLFLKNQRRAISRKAIATALWKFEPSDDVINHAICHLRKTVGDCIVTIPGFGYRFDGV